MKVLWLSPTPCGSIRKGNQPLIGGGWLISLEDELKKRPNIELHVAYFAETREAAFIYKGVTYHPMGYEKPLNKIQRVLERRENIDKIDEKRLPWMLSVIDQSQPDIIHIHGSEGSFITVLPHIVNIPIVVSIQGMLGPIGEKYYAGIPESTALKNESMRDLIHMETTKCQFKSLYDRAKREERYLQQVKYIIGRTFLDESYTCLLTPERQYYVVNEILRPEFYNVQWKGFIDTTCVKIVTTISGAIYKGIETILKSAYLLKKYAKCQFEWHIIGYDDQSKWVKISEKMTGLNCHDCNLIFHGRIDALSLSKFLCESDIYVNASHIENSPNSVCEAMLVGMPIIATYAGGTASLLKHEEDGILVQDGAPYVMAGAIVNIIHRPEDALMLASSAREKALVRHNKVSIVNELMSTYNSILEDYSK